MDFLGNLPFFLFVFFFFFFFCFFLPHSHAREKNKTITDTLYTLQAKVCTERQTLHCMFCAFDEMIFMLNN